MKDSKTIGFPDPLVKDSEKKDPAYGLKYAQAIAQEWFNGGTLASESNSEYAQRRDWIRANRLFVRGEQDIEPYKKHMVRQEGDLDYLNLDWTPINLAEKFCRIVINGISDEHYRLNVSAIDKTATTLRKDKEAQYKKMMRTMPLLENTKQMLGLDLTPKGFVPEDNEELALWMEIKERPKIEISEELMIDGVKRLNNWEHIEKSKNQDLVINGISVGRGYTDPSNGVVPEYVDPEFYIHSQTSKGDFSDVFYHGVVDSVTINDIRRESGLGEKELREIAKMYGGHKDHYKSPSHFESCPFDELLDIRVDVLRFCFKSSKAIVYKKSVKKGNRVKVSKRDDNYNPPERSDYGRLDQILDTWYEGTYVIGTEYLYDYKESENLVRDEMNKAQSPFVVYAPDIYRNRLRSFLTNMKAPIQQMQYIHYKIQHLIAELRPDLINIDLDALAVLGDAEGGSKRQDWKEALNIMNVKGVVFTERVDMGEMGIKESSPARPIGNAQGSALAPLLNSWAHYYNMLRDLTGVNPVRDGSQPHDSLVGVNEMAMLASNTATKHIVDASTAFNKKFAELISSRIHTIFSHDDASHLQEMYAKIVGKYSVEAVEALKDRNLHDFGFTVEMKPTLEENKQFREDLSIAMQEGFIDVEVKHQAQMIYESNPKLANQYLHYRRRKAKKEALEQRQYEAQLQSESNAKAAQASEQAKLQSYAMQSKVDIEKEQVLARLEILKEQAKHQLKMKEGAQEFKYDAYLKQLEAATQFEMKDFLENRKDDRQREAASQQSKLIDQRTKDKEPIDFESAFDFGEIL